MTDELRLFSESLESIKRRTIKVEERKLYSNQRDMTIMKAKDDECELRKTLYVSDLEVNLLSARRLIKKNFKSSFDDKNLYMHITNDTKVFKAIAQNDVYIVDKISSQIDDIALSAILTSDTNELIEVISSTLSAMTEHSKNDHENFIEKFTVLNSVESKLIAAAFAELNSEATVSEDTSSRKRDLFTL